MIAAVGPHVQARGRQCLSARLLAWQQQQPQPAPLPQHQRGAAGAHGAHAHALKRRRNLQHNGLAHNVSAYGSGPRAVRVSREREGEQVQGARTLQHDGLAQQRRRLQQWAERGENAKGKGGRASAGDMSAAA